jgi:hypothetical protein
VIHGKRFPKGKAYDGYHEFLSVFHKILVGADSINYTGNIL